MRLIHFVIAISANDHQMAHRLIREQVTQKFQGCRIDPLQIIQKYHQWMIGLTKYQYEIAENQIDPVLRLGRLQLRYRRLRTENDLKIRQCVDDELSVGSECLLQPHSPIIQLLFIFSQHLLDQIA